MTEGGLNSGCLALKSTTCSSYSWNSFMAFLIHLAFFLTFMSRHSCRARSSRTPRSLPGSSCVSSCCWKYRSKGLPGFCGAPGSRITGFSGSAARTMFVFGCVGVFAVFSVLMGLRSGYIL